MINIDAIAKTVAEKIVAKVDANTADYAEDFDTDNLIDQAVEDVCEGTPLNPEDLFDVVAGHREVEMAIQGARIIVQDWVSDQELWKDGPMKVYGLKQADFV
jgi:hypothetical protein